MKLSLPRILLLSCLLFFPLACYFLHVDTPPPSSEKEAYQIHFNNIAMTEYLRFVAKISGRNFIFDQADLLFSVTIVSEESVDIENIFSALTQVLKINNLTLLEQDDNYIISKSDPIFQIPEEISRNDLENSRTKTSLVTRVFRIRNTDVNSVATIIRSMVSQKSLVSVSNETSQLILTDTATNINKVATLLSLIESPHNPLQIESYTATNVSTKELIALAEESVAPLSEGNPLIFVDQLETNTIFIVSTSNLIKQTMMVFRDLDVSKSSKSENVEFLGKLYRKIAALKAENTELSEDVPTIYVKKVVAASKGDPTFISSPDEDPQYSFAVPKRIVLSHAGTNGNGMGYATNYTTLGLFFAPVYETDRFLPMVDIRGHRFDNDTYAGNIGLLTRYIKESAPRIFGLNLYYDYRQGNQGTYNQFSAGIEILGKRWDFRANGYVPVGNKTFTSCCIYDDYIGDYVAIRRDNEFVSFGCNAEVGYLITKSINYLLYAAAGPYYLSGKFNSQVRGGEIRLRPQFKDYVAVDLRLSHDSVFNTVFQIEVIVSLPLYQVTLPKNKKGANGLTNRQIYQPVERFEVVPIGKRCCWDANW